MATLTGTLDGMTVDVSAALNARLINQVSDPKTVTIGWEGGSVTFEWMGDYASAGTPTSATGTLRLDGTTYCFDTGSFTIEDDGFDRWTVSGFSESPDDGETCPGTTMLDGEVEGCADENGPS
jgi:hypothetical protein